MSRKISFNVGKRRFVPNGDKLVLLGGGIISSMFSDPILTQEELNDIRNDPLTGMMISMYDGTGYMRIINSVLGGNPTEAQLEFFYFLMDQTERQLVNPNDYENVKIRVPPIIKNIKKKRY